ncbi:MAG: extracellular solute-binding protein [Treponema sp.]|nr:extracellular solute-binding protein [Treponema sp.]
MKNFIIFFFVLSLLIPAAVFSGGSSAGRGAETNSVAFNKEGYPIVTAPYTLKAVTVKQQFTRLYDQLPAFQRLEAKTGVHIDWDYIGADWATQKPLVLASGDLPDIFYGRTVLTEDDVISNRELFYNLTPLIDQYGNNLKNIFQENPIMLNLAKAYDGNIWGLPHRQFYRPQNYALWMINQNWLDKLGLSMPTTTDELITVLRAFKNGDPNGNGKADEIPWSWTWVSGIAGPMDIFGAFGVVIDSSNSGFLSVTNGKVQYVFAQDGFQDGVAYLHQLYAEGLIDQEVFTHDNSMWRAKVLQNDPEIVGMFGQWGRSSFIGADRAAYYPMVMPLKGPKGYQFWDQNPEVTEYARYTFEISKACTRPEIAMRWIDTIYDDMTSLEVFLGTDNLKMLDNGRIEVIESGNDKWIYGLNDLFAGYASDQLNSKLIMTVEDEMMADKKRLSAYYPKEYYPYGMVAMTPQEVDELALLRTDIQSFAMQQTATWITKGGVENEYAGFIKQLENMGLRRMEQIYQQIYDRYIGK